MDSVVSGLQPISLGAQADTLRDAFGRALVALGTRYPDFVVLDADVAGGTGTHHFRRAFPERFFQCGIAEQNMMSMAAGFAGTGQTPFVTSFAVFCLRALEQVRLSIAYPRRNVKIVASHPGLDAGPDGASAQALEDLAAFRAIPGMVVVSPADAIEMAAATEAVLKYDGPVYMRTGRSPAPRCLPDDYHFEIGRARVLRQGDDVAIIACGVEVARALQAAARLAEEGIEARVVNMATLKPLDVSQVVACARETGAIVTAEDHNVHGGLGSAVAECLVRHWPCVMEMVAVKDVFGESGEPQELAQKYGLSADHIVAAVRQVLRRKPLR